MAGKGSKYRPVDHKRYDANYELIFRKKDNILESEEAKESLNDELDRTSFSEIQKCCGRCKCSEF